jgi:CBS domain-containing protein
MRAFDSRLRRNVARPCAARHAGSEEETAMGRVADILAAKGSDVHGISADATVYECVEHMVRNNVGSVLVMTGGAVTGIFTERDYLRRIVLEGRTSRATPVRDVMTSRVICVEPETTIEHCMSIMSRERIRHLPVMEGNRLAGIVSIGDLVRRLSSEKEVEVRYLTDYIAGKYPG